MKQQISIRRDGGGISSVCFPTERFKSFVITLNFAVPLTKETASDFAIIPNLLHRTCKKYPRMSELNARLAELYGAVLFAETDKLGDVQALHIGITAVDDRFSLDGESISLECARLLCDAVFDPALEGEAFREEDISREKRLLLETLDSEYNEKRIYARKRLEKIMFENEPYGIDRLGDRESIEKITPASAWRAWRRMLETAGVHINIIGNVDSEKVLDVFREAFKSVNRSDIDLPGSVIAKETGQVKRVEERLEVAQSKLVMGYRVLADDIAENAPVYAVTVDLFGGGPYSRLFMNVRERLSLCYYCSARFIRQKGAVILQSGVEEKNITPAEEEIGRQLQVMKRGEFTDDELSASKLALTDAVGSIEDSLFAIDNWYSRQMLLPEILNPEEYREKLGSVTRDQVMRSADRIRLDTVYVLTGSGREEA